VKFTLESPTAVTVRSVSDREIRIGDQRWSQTIALTSTGVLDNWVQQPIDALRIEDFSSLLDAGVSLVILGTGRTHVIPPRELVFGMARNGIGFEVMDTRAAARTFNVLVGEGRPAGAVLYL
jgi:uncharacterized protein